jgi:hypothetical protein
MSVLEYRNDLCEEVATDPADNMPLVSVRRRKQRACAIRRLLPHYLRSAHLITHPQGEPQLATYSRVHYRFRINQESTEIAVKPTSNSDSHPQLALFVVNANDGTDSIT